MIYSKKDCARIKKQYSEKKQQELLRICRIRGRIERMIEERQIRRELSEVWEMGV